MFLCSGQSDWLLSSQDSGNLWLDSNVGKIYCSSVTALTAIGCCSEGSIVEKTTRVFLVCIPSTAITERVLGERVRCASFDLCFATCTARVRCHETANLIRPIEISAKERISSIPIASISIYINCTSSVLAFVWNCSGEICNCRSSGIPQFLSLRLSAFEIFI